MDNLLLNDPQADTGCHVGPCRCGGYGVLLDETQQQIYGTCHLTNGDEPPLHETMRQAIRRAVGVIERAENRCLAVDGDVPETLTQMTEADLREIYRTLAPFAYPTYTIGVDMSNGDDRSVYHEPAPDRRIQAPPLDYVRETWAPPRPDTPKPKPPSWTRHPGRREQNRQASAWCATVAGGITLLLFLAICLREVLR